MKIIPPINALIDLETEKHRPLAFFGVKAHESHESVREWVKWCKCQGFGGFNMIIASDCDGRANELWISMVMDAYDIALQTASEEGLNVWIFDDWGYPSGTAGGLVCTEDAFRLKRLTISHDCTLKPGEQISFTIPVNFVSGGVIRSSAFHRMNLQPRQILSYAAGDTDERIVIITWEFDTHQAKSSCKSYPGDPAMSCIDMLNPNATKRFLEVMHEGYYRRFSKYFGTVIKGFFYDEPYLSFPFPWSENLPSEFKAKKGYDLLDILPPLMLHIHEPSEVTKKYADDYFDVWTGMAADNFFGQLSRWCREHGVALSGHMDLDHHLNTLSTISGHFYKNMEYNTSPAVDVIWAQIEPGEFTDFPRYAGSVKRLLGRKHAVSETFAGMGQRLHGDLMRYITDHQVIRGIDDFHLMYSNNSPTAPAESPQMPNHMLQEPFGRLIYERIAKASAISSLGIPSVSVALYMPAFDLYRSQMAIGGITSNNAEKFPWEWVNDIARKLVYMPCDFDYIWDEAILELALSDGGLLTGSGNIIHTIFLPPGCTLTGPVVRKLKEFHYSGGRVVSVFRPNGYLEEALLCPELVFLKDYVNSTISISPVSSISLCTRVKEGVTGVAVPPLFCSISLCTRVMEDKTAYMLLNESTKPLEVQIGIDQEGSLSEISLVDGRVEFISGNGPFQLATRFEGCQLKVYIVNKAPEQTVTGNAQIKEVISPTTQEVHDSEAVPCISRTDIFDKAVFPVNWTVTFPDNRIARLDGVNWPDWSELGWPVYSGAMKYTAEFDWQSTKDTAFIDIPDLHYHAIVLIDGEEAGKIAFKPYGCIVHKLSRGHHLLELWVYNSGANEVCGTLETEKERYSKRFAHIAAYDRKWLKSGITGMVTISPVES